MQDQGDIERLGGRLGGLLAVEHPEEVGCVRERGVGLDDLLALADAVEDGDDHRDLRGQAKALADVRGVQGGLLVGVVDGEQRDGGAQDFHGRRRLGDVAQERDHVVGNLACGGELVREVVEFSSGRECAVPQEIGDLFKAGLLRKLVDIDSAVGEDAFVPIDKADGRFIGDDVL